VRVQAEIRKCHLTGANPVRPKPPCRSVATPCDVRDGERAEAGRRRARRCVGARASEPHEVSLENFHVPSVQGIGVPEDRSRALTQWHKRAEHEAGSRCAARSKKMTQKPGRPVRSVESRRPKARETKAWAECVAGVGGPHTSDEAEERVTPDSAERRGSARVGSSFRRETWAPQRRRHKCHQDC